MLPFNAFANKDVAKLRKNKNIKKYLAQFFPPNNHTLAEINLKNSISMSVKYK